MLFKIKLKYYLSFKSLLCKFKGSFTLKCPGTECSYVQWNFHLKKYQNPELFTSYNLASLVFLPVALLHPIQSCPEALKARETGYDIPKFLVLGNLGYLECIKMDYFDLLQPNCL